MSDVGVVAGLLQSMLEAFSRWSKYRGIKRAAKNLSDKETRDAMDNVLGDGGAHNMGERLRKYKSRGQSSGYDSNSADTGRKVE